MNYPNLRWIRSELRYNVTKPLKVQILKAYIVGSEAKGTATESSDLDIAIVIPEKKISSLQFTENYHSCFKDNYFKPDWNGRVVDFQFFYPDDKQLESYSKIEISENLFFDKNLIIENLKNDRKREKNK